MTRLRIDAVATGGDAIGRLDGKAVFVPGAIPGDVVEVRIEVDRKRYAKARLVEVVEASPDRIAAPCPHAALCGGCSWQMVDRSRQLVWKERGVVDALERIGHFDEPAVRPIAAPGPPFRYRNRLDLHPSVDGPGFYEAGSHRMVAIETCLLAAPPVEELLSDLVGVPGDRPLTLRAGMRTGTSAVIGATDDGPPPVITESVDGVEFRVTGTAFFQPNTDGADAIVGFVGDALTGLTGGLLVDAYAGVGLLAGTVGRRFSDVVAVEVDPVATADLAVNVPDAQVVEAAAADALRRLPRPPTAVVVDPPRAGLGSPTVAALLAAAPDVIASVSCDPATFARDARELVAGGYRLEWVQPVDQFPQTPHTETVARFVR